jgi:hypothetical protein
MQVAQKLAPYVSVPSFANVSSSAMLNVLISVSLDVSLHPTQSAAVK